MTRPFAAIERFFERIFERPAARLFHTPVQPIQVQRKLERAMDTGRVFSGDRTYVPNRYRVRLNPADARPLDGYRPTLEAELADALHARARSRGYRLLARPAVAIEASSRIAVADIDVIAEVIDPRTLDGLNGRQEPVGPTGTGVFGTHAAPAAPPASAPPAAWAPAMAGPAPAMAGPAPAMADPRPFAPEPAPLAADPWSAPADLGPMTAAPAPVPDPPSEVGAMAPTFSEATVAFAFPGTPAPLARIEVRTHGVVAGSHDYTSGSVRVGRASSNDIVLVDDRASRHHGQFSSRQGTLVYADLGSTNGSFVNGTRVREIVLGSGDVVRLGNSTLTIQPHA